MMRTEGIELVLEKKYAKTLVVYLDVLEKHISLMDRLEFDKGNKDLSNKLSSLSETGDKTRILMTQKRLKNLIAMIASIGQIERDDTSEEKEDRKELIEELKTFLGTITA